MSFFPGGLAWSPNQLRRSDAAVHGDHDLAVQEGQAARFQDPWMRHFLVYDPAPALASLRAPVLALWDTKDLQVLPAVNPAPHGKRLSLAILEASDRKVISRIGNPFESSLLINE
jgi:hypothetical protein